MVMVRVMVMVRDAKCWNIFPVEVAVCSSWRRGQESGVTGSGTQPDIYSIRTASRVFHGHGGPTAARAPRTLAGALTRTVPLLGTQQRSSCQ